MCQPPKPRLLLTHNSTHVGEARVAGTPTDAQVMLQTVAQQEVRWFGAEPGRVRVSPDPGHDSLGPGASRARTHPGQEPPGPGLATLEPGAVFNWIMFVHF